MPNYNIRAFSNGPNNMRSASDFINRKRAETSYTVAASNVQAVTKYNNNSNVPVKAGSCINMLGKNLSSVGGFNVNSYDLLLDITKGKYYTAKDGRNITLLSDGLLNPSSADTLINDCGPTKISINNNISNVSAPISQTWGINEGPFLSDNSGALLYKNIPDTSANCGCSDPVLAKNPNIIINNSLYNSSGLARWNNENPLRGFNFPKTFYFSYESIPTFMSGGSSQTTLLSQRAAAYRSDFIPPAPWPVGRWELAVGWWSPLSFSISSPSFTSDFVEARFQSDEGATGIIIIKRDLSFEMSSDTSSLNYEVTGNWSNDTMIFLNINVTIIEHGPQDGQYSADPGPTQGPKFIYDSSA